MYPTGKVIFNSLIYRRIWLRYRLRDSSNNSKYDIDKVLLFSYLRFLIVYYIFCGVAKNLEIIKKSPKIAIKTRMTTFIKTKNKISDESDEY